MPNFTERESLLIKRIKKMSKGKGTGTEGGKDEEKKENKDDEEDEDEDEESEEEEESEEDDEDEEDEEDSDEEEEKGKNVNRTSLPGKGASSTAASGALDLLGGFDFGGGKATSSLFPPQSSSVTQSLFAKESGVLYESNELQIGTKLSVENNNCCKLIFYYGNKCPSTIRNVKVILEDSENYKIQIKPSELFDVPPKKQIPHFFLIHCFKPFKGPIPISISFFYADKEHTLQLSVPISMNRFIVPTTLEPAAFVSAWQKYGNELIGMRKVESKLTVTELSAIVSKELNLSLVNGVEKTADNIVAAGVFHTATKLPNGTTVTMPCLLRVETKPNINLIRITVHSGHPTVSDALLHTVTLAFNAKEQ